MKREITERQKKLLQKLNLGFTIFISAGIGLLIGVVFGARVMISEWMENEAFHVDQKAAIYKEFGEIDKADSVLTIHQLRDSVLKNNILTIGLAKN